MTKRLRQGKLYVVTWSDASACRSWSDWDDVTDLADKPWRAETVGWLIRQDKQAIVLCASRALDVERWDFLLRIPRPAIIDVKMVMT